MRMRTGTVATWAGFVLSALSTTGCMGGNQNVRQPATPLKNVSPATAAAPANGSAWGRQSPPAAAKSAGDSSALANPTGNTPQFNVQPTNGITPTGGLAPPALVPAAPSPAAGIALPTVPSTSNLIPTAPSMNSLNGGTPLGAAPAPARQVAANAARPADTATRVSVPQPAAAVTDEPSGPLPAIPPAAAASELPLQMPPPITTMSPAPTKVRQ
jgi:hypothetical protein